MNNQSEILREEARELAEIFANELAEDINLEYRIKSRPDGYFLIIEFAYPTERFFRVLERINDKLSEAHVFKDRLVLEKRHKKPKNVITIPETQLLKRELSESLTVDRHTFGSDFFLRYTPSVTNYEQSIIGKSNYVVYGRRGSGKSSLLSYAMHKLKKRNVPFAWIAMQTYSGRSDNALIVSVISEIFNEIRKYVENQAEIAELSSILNRFILDESHDVLLKLTKVIPLLRNVLSSITSQEKPLTIFLDDIHVIDVGIQVELLGMIYALTRGNNSYIKASGIEQFTKTWDSGSRKGLEPPHDTQILKLDNNLTMPDKSKEHIYSILDAHARYCGLPGINYIADDSVISRLVLVAAAVPRDALSLLSLAVSKSAIKGQKSVSITGLNAVASEAVEEKIKDISSDSKSQDFGELNHLLEKIKKFCIKEQRKNAFLVRIENQSHGFGLIQKLIALRMVHVLHEGITPHKAGERYIALMLDYGFYIGIRAARSVELYPETPRLLPAKELRKLLIFDPNE